MKSVKFLTATVGVSNLVSNFAAQDFEAIPTNVPLPPFTSSEAHGSVSFAYAVIGFTPPKITNTNFGSEDFQSYPDGPITVINNSFYSGAVKLAPAYLNPPSA